MAFTSATLRFAPPLPRRRRSSFSRRHCLSISNSGVAQHDHAYLRHRSTPGEYAPTNLTLKHACSDHYPLDLFQAALSFGRDGKELRRREQNTVAGEKDDEEEDGVEMSVILPESEETVANIFSALGKPDDDPHWADVWHGGIALNEYLVLADVAHGGGGSLVRGKRVLELGCGVGLTGVLCAMEGAKKVTMTDREPFACYCAVASAIANGFGTVTKALDEDASVVDGLAQMDVGLLENVVDRSSRSRQKCECVEAKIMDWFKLDEYLKKEDDFAYDVVIACDCLYCEEAVEAVASIVFEAFSRGRRRQQEQDVSSPFTFLLADPPSRFPQNHAKFLEIMQEKSGVNDVKRKDTLLAVRNPCQEDEGEIVVKICEYTFR
jgi:predicted nicotinamide N-methyase